MEIIFYKIHFHCLFERITFIFVAEKKYCFYWKSIMKPLL
jgi:hypothetical protein